MLHPVWPNVNFWYFLGLHSSLLWLIPSMEMEFIKKSIPRVGVFVRLTILFSWFGGNTVLSIIFFSLKNNPRTYHFFRGYECVGRTVGYAVVLFGNIGLYYYSEKSIACMLTFLFLGFSCLCTLFYIQPFTDFGVLDFFLSASLTQALSLFGLHIYSWLVFIAVIVVAALRYQLELVLCQQQPREVESGRTAKADSEGGARDIKERDSEPAMDMIKVLQPPSEPAKADSEEGAKADSEERDSKPAMDMIKVLQPQREVELERIGSNVQNLRIPENSDRLPELRRGQIKRRLLQKVLQLQREVELERIGSNVQN